MTGTCRPVFFVVIIIFFRFVWGIINNTSKQNNTATKEYTAIFVADKTNTRVASFSWCRLERKIYSFEHTI